MLLSEPAQRNAVSIESSCQNSAQRNRRFIKHNPIYYFFFLPLGPAPGAAKALPRRQVRVDPAGVNPQGQVLHRRRWVQEGPGCNAEIEAASAFPGHSLP